MTMCRSSADGVAMEVVGHVGVWIEPVRGAGIGVENDLGQARQFVEEPVVPKKSGANKRHAIVID